MFLNGQIVKSKEATIQISDLAILRGYGVFDFLRVIDAKPIFLDDYLARFERSVMGLALHLPYTKQDLREKIYDLIGLHKHHLLGVRMVCTGGYADDAYTPTLSNTFIIVKPLHFHPYDQGLHLMSVDFQRDLYHIKSINYLRPISLLQEMKAVHADDVLYHKDGYVTESSRSNVFIIKKGVLITPDSGMLEGITRMKYYPIRKGNFTNRNQASDRDRLIVLLGAVPLAITSALIFTYLDLTTVNIYSQVGLITLVGLVAKNGILIVEFANHLQEQGLSKVEAAKQAGVTRFRPVLMTSVATVAGHAPLIFVTGEGAAARNNIGVVLVSGMIISTFFTLLFVPSIYVLLAGTHKKREHHEPGHGPAHAPASNGVAPTPALA